MKPQERPSQAFMAFLARGSSPALRQLERVPSRISRYYECMAGYKIAELALRTVAAGGLVLALISTLALAEPLAVKIGYVGRAEKKATIALVEAAPDKPAPPTPWRGG